MKFNSRKMKILILYSTFIWFLSFLFGIISMYTIDITKNSAELNSIFNFFDNNIDPGIGIIIHNLKVVLVMIIGAFSLGMTTVINLIANGLGYGLLIGYSLKIGVPIKDIILLTIPHGIFELPALWLASAAGLNGTFVFLGYIRGENEKVTAEDITEFLIFSFLSVIFILIAGIIEIKLTYRLLEVIP